MVESDPGTSTNNNSYFFLVASDSKGPALSQSMYAMCTNTYVHRLIKTRQLGRKTDTSSLLALQPQLDSHTQESEFDGADPRSKQSCA